MNSVTTFPLGNDFPKQLAISLFDTIDKATRHAYRIIWDWLTQFLVEYWGWVIVALIFIFLFAVAEYFLTGRWAILGRVLYSYLYFGTLFVISWVFGPEVFANDWFKIVLFVVYVSCFILVGKILKKAGVRK